MQPSEAISKCSSLEFLRVHRNEGCGPVMHIVCAATDKLEVLKWIHAYYPFLLVSFGAASQEARYNGHLHIIQWRNEFQTRSLSFSIKIITRAAR
ncbi:hypothetical protein Gpo141_00013116 [Globisporangium polare]